MKIVHVIYDSLGNPWLGGGGAHRIHEIYKRLAKNNDITIFSGNFRNAAKVIDGVKYVHIGLPFNYLLSRLSFIFLIYFYIVFSRADVYVEDLGAPFPLGLVLLRAQTIASAQFVPNQSYREKRRLTGWATVLLFNKFAKLYGNFIVVSEFVGDYIKTINKNADVFVLEHGVNLPQELNNKTQNYILFLGRIDVFGKGLDTLIEAASILRDANNTGFKIIIAGSGENSEIKKLNGLIEGKKLSEFVSYVGQKIGKDKAEIFSDCLFFVSPSRNEASSMTALEAFSYGKPVIGTDVGGMGELLKKSDSALICSPNDSTILAETILKLLNDAKLREELSQNAKIFIKQFSWDQVAQKYEDYLKTHKFYVAG